MPQVTLDIPDRLLVSEQAKREAFAPLADTIARRHGQAGTLAIEHALMVGFAYAISGPGGAEYVASQTKGGAI